MLSAFRCAVASLAFTVALWIFAANGQTANAPVAKPPAIPVNYDETQVGTYTLPDPLRLATFRCKMDAGKHVLAGWDEILSKQNNRFLFWFA